MARVLIVGCGCRGRALATRLVEGGHAVRGTTRSPDGLAAIGATGADAVLADPGRLGTLLPLLQGVSALCWLLGSAAGEDAEVAALHGPRLAWMLATLVDTPVRGLVYEAAGTVAADMLEGGGVIARAQAVTHRMPVHVVEADPADLPGWLRAMRSAVEAVLTA